MDGPVVFFQFTIPSLLAKSYLKAFEHVGACLGYLQAVLLP